jgi:hypothetical protein
MKTRNLQTYKTKIWLPLFVIGLALATYQAVAQTPIAKWTFESSGLGSTTPNFLPGANTVTTNFYAEQGTQAGIAVITGKHLGSATYTSPAGNGSTKSLSANTWTNSQGDYWQIAVNTTSFTNINLTFDAVGSATGPKDFKVMYSTDGVNFTQFSTYAVLSSPSWSAATPAVGETYTFDFSPITSLANSSTVFLRLVVNSTNNIGGGSGGGVAQGGASRIDNVVVAGTLSGPPQIIAQPANSTNYFGDSANITVVAGGDAPLSFQWYSNSTPLTGLVDGSSGYGSGTIAGTTNATLALTLLNTNQTGNYRVVVSNFLGSVTSSVVHLQVNTRPTIIANIADLHKLHDTNFALTDTTNLYQINGIVTTIGNLVSGTTPVNSFFVQDGTGGIDVFFRGGFDMPVQGDRVVIVAPLLQFSGLLEVNPIPGNPAHSVTIVSSGNLVPAPQPFNFTTQPTATNYEESLEGRYLVVSNVFLAYTNADQHLAGNGIIFMTNLTGQVFRMSVANNPLLGPVGTILPGTYASAVRGVLSQSQTSGTVLTNGYSIVLSDFSQIDFTTPPILPIPLTYGYSAGTLTMSWTDSAFTLQSSTNVTGPYVDVPGAVSPFTTNAAASAIPVQFFRLNHAP